MNKENYIREFQAGSQTYAMFDIQQLETEGIPRSGACRFPFGFWWKICCARWMAISSKRKTC